MEVQPPPHGVRGRPLVEGAPGVGAGVEQPGFGEPPVACALEPVSEPTGLELPVLDAGSTAEAHVAQRRAGIAGPLSVVPRTHDQVREPCGVGPLERGVMGERTVLVLLVPPSSHHERRHGRVAHIARQRAGLPHRVVRRVL